MAIIEKLKTIVASDSRTKEISKNILGLGCLQVINILVSFMLVPIVMNFVTPSQYGIWLTISSIISWLSLLDVGLGTGMKNKLTEALANNDIKLAKEYVSTTYIMISCIVTVFLVVIYIVFPYINWSMVYNQDVSMNDTLQNTTLIVTSFFLIKLIVSLIGTILTSYLKPALNQFLNTLSNIIILIIIWIMSKIFDGNLIILSTVLSSTSVVIYLIASLLLFNGKFKDIAPSIFYFRKEQIKSILGLGINFFIINISTIVLFQTNNFIIIHYFTNEDVVVYNLAYKLFSICSILFMLISQPFWTAYTEAWAKKDIDWIKRTVKKVYGLWALVICFGIIILIASPLIYNIWVGDSVVVPFSMSVAILAYFTSHTYGGVFNICINGIGKVRLQMYCLAIVAIIYIPIMLLFIKVFKFGMISIPMAQLISNFYSLFIARVQYNKIILGTAKGIWYK